MVHLVVVKDSGYLIGLPVVGEIITLVLIGIYAPSSRWLYPFLFMVLKINDILRPSLFSILAVPHPQTYYVVSLNWQLIGPSILD